MADKKNEVLIIIPVYNEAANISKVINGIKSVSQAADILIVDDGSTDNTPEALIRENVFTVRHVFNLGIGSSFQTGCRFAAMHNYSYIIRMDGDGQHNPAFIKDILVPVKKEDFDIVVGSRFLGGSEFKSSFFRRVGISTISAVLMLITKKRFTDPTSGFCAMNKPAYQFFAESCAEDYPEPEIFLHHLDFRIKEVPMSMAKRANGLSSINNIKAIYYMYKVLFSIFVSIFRKE